MPSFYRLSTNICWFKKNKKEVFKVMPLPKPKEGEKKNDFISRFMNDENAKKEFESNSQRLAVAYSIWDRETKKNKK